MKNQFRAIDDKFFYFDVFENYEFNNIIFVHKKFIYWEVFIFVQWMKNYAHVVNETSVYENLSLYFKNIVMTWYLKKIDEFKQKFFKNILFVNFINEFKSRFKMRINKTFEKLISKTFIVKDVKNNWKITNFLKNIILYI